MSTREQYIKLALSYLPHIIQLVDRNPYSPSYGCFDREYWHYKTHDFPCGMSQKMVLPLALLYKNEYPGNHYYQWERLKELSIAGIKFAVKSSHRNGSCDDYFPYEQALGALVFSTYAFTEVYQLLELDDEQLLDFFKLRGDFLINNDESGRLANHQALAALALYNIYLVCGNERYKRASEDRVNIALSWQHADEGWFQEYEGADPGYQTCTIDFLAKLLQKSNWTSLVKPLIKAVDFAGYFMHPDGSYGGEYGSRNTYHFYPHGFEIMARYNNKALQMNELFFKGVKNGKRYFNEDDRMCSHTVSNWLQAYEDYWPDRNIYNTEDVNYEKWFADAGLFIKRNNKYHAVCNLKKGGVIKVHDSNHCLYSDTGMIGELKNGSVIVSHLHDEVNLIEVNPEESCLCVEGVFAYRNSKYFNPVKLIVFRLVNITIGKYFPNILRTIVQKILITQKPRTNYKFRRKVSFAVDGVTVVDEINKPIPLSRLSIGSDATSIYVANSNVYQESVLRCSWKHASGDLIKKAREGAMTWSRKIKNMG